MPNTNDAEQRDRLARAILENCAIKSGGLDALSRRLGVDRETLVEWVSGKTNPPADIVQKAAEPFLKQ